FLEGKALLLAGQGLSREDIFRNSGKKPGKTGVFDKGKEATKVSPRSLLARGCRAANRSIPELTLGAPARRKRLRRRPGQHSFREKFQDLRCTTGAKVGRVQFFERQKVSPDLLADLSCRLAFVPRRSNSARLIVTGGGRQSDLFLV